MVKDKIFLSVLVCLLGLCSCKYSKLLKSPDYEAKYQAALSYYEKHDYNRALELFELTQAFYRGKMQGENIAFLTAESYYNLGEYSIASQYYKRYAATYPFGGHTEEAMFKSAYCYFEESPNISLDQTDTYTAISEFQQFTDTYPKSELVDSANILIDKLRYKLEQKDYQTCLLYYKMDEFRAAITSFETLMKDYPGTRHREEILYYMVMTYYNYAEKSVTEKQRERYELSLEKFNTLTYMYPDSEYIAKLEPVVLKIREKLSK